MRGLTAKVHHISFTFENRVECNLRASYKSLVATCGAETDVGAASKRGVGFSNIWSDSFLEQLRKHKPCKCYVFNFDFFMKVIEEGRKGEKLQSCKTVTFPITFT